MSEANEQQNPGSLATVSIAKTMPSYEEEV